MYEIGKKHGVNFPVMVDVRWGFVIPPWLFNIFIDGLVRVMKAKNREETKSSV